MLTTRKTARDVALPVLRPGRSAGRARRSVPRRSSIARWRAGVLIGVHLLMAAHIIHWAVTGRSLGRFVLSDSMRTLELGEINPGFLLFALAIVVTAVCGRLMCGWVCHMGALQDASAWALRKVGVRPRLFRSRVLGFVPLGLAVYMFVWPTFEREVLAPAESARAFPGFSVAMTTDRLWEGLPAWYVAVPFLLLCGVGTVYFLGARGLCRYGCPYGGFLLPAEQLAPMRVVVDPVRCDQCGLCTAACTMGVRVHDEVRQYGAVTDRNCVRSLDCVGACPQRALSFTLARPAAFSRPVPTEEPARSRFDLTLGEEAVCLGVWLVTFFSTRGLYDLVPLLMSATLSVLAAFVAWKALRLWKDPNVRLSVVQLRMRGSMRPAGWAFTACAAALGLLLLHSALVRVILWRASAADDRVRVSLSVVMAGEPVPPEQLAAAREARALLELARPLWRGGLALAATPPAGFRLAWMDLVTGDQPAAERELRALIQSGRGAENAAPQLARVLVLAGRADEAISVLEAEVQGRPRSVPAREALAEAYAKAGRPGDAESVFRAAVDRDPTDADARAGLGRWLLRTGRLDEAIDALQSVATEWPRRTAARQDLAVALFTVGLVDDALAELRAAADANPPERAGCERLADQMRDRAKRHAAERR